MSDSPLWRPPSQRATRSKTRPPERVTENATLMRRFARQAKDRAAPIPQAALQNPPSYYPALHAWSLREPADFWELVWDFCGIVGDKGAPPFYQPATRMKDARFFPEAQLNFAENLLRHGIGREQETAVRFRDETCIDHGADQFLTWGDLRRRTACVQHALRESGIGEGDRIAAILPNMPAAITLALAASSIGAVFSSCSPDYGAQGILDRFAQIDPKLLVACDSCRYNGKHFAQTEKLREILAALPNARLWIQRISGDEAAMQLPGARCFETIATAADSPPLAFAPLPFDHPLYIVFSSGTTGAPKCMVHRAGGVLLQHCKEHQLHADIHPPPTPPRQENGISASNSGGLGGVSPPQKEGAARAGNVADMPPQGTPPEADALCYFTTCSWMMWNWMLSALASGAQLHLYDGSPLYPDNETLFAYAAAAGATHLGVSPKLLDLLRQEGKRPAQQHDLSRLRCLLSSGSPLSGENFRYAYEHIKPDLHLSPISGGTELLSCFVGGNPDAPVWEGEMQGINLGMGVEIWNEKGEPLPPGEKGELVCTRPFPTMPLHFWNDPDGERYHQAYFAHYPGVWRHGDFAAITEHNGVIIFGRSDALLNIGGIRVGTAELYAVVERFAEIAASVAIAQEWPPSASPQGSGASKMRRGVDNGIQLDTRIILFVQMREGETLDDTLAQRLRSAVAQRLNPRFVPAVILPVADIPRTKSGKISEMAAREAVHGREVKNRAALENPESLDLFRNRPELAA